MMELFSVNVSPETIVKSVNGAITGKIHIKVDDYVFPEYEWDDFVVIVMGWWLKEIASLYSANNKNCSCHFMDGPFQFNVEVIDLNTWMIRLTKRGRLSDEYVLEGTIIPLIVIRGVLSAAGSLIKLCQEKGWSSPEITTLLEAYAEMRMHC